MLSWVKDDSFLTGLLVFSLCAFVHGALWDANFTAVCESERQSRIGQNQSLADDPTFVCAQEYNAKTLPAANIKIKLSQCLVDSPGWERSRFRKPGQWAGPLVGFLLPSIGFIISIPREWNLNIESARVDDSRPFVHWLSLMAMPLALVLDTLVGIAIVFGWAGSFIAGSIHEVLVDRKILKRVTERLKHNPGQVKEQEWFALAIILVGSFADDTRLSHSINQATGQSIPLNNNPNSPLYKPQTFADVIQFELRHPREPADFLSRIGIQCSSVTHIAGISLIFYIGAFIFGLVDASERLGENDTAHSVAFGLWYFVIVLVAIISSTVMGIVTPTDMRSALAHRRPQLKDKDCKRKWLSERRITLAHWAERPSMSNSNGRAIYEKDTSVFYLSSIPLIAAALALIVIAVPCGLAIAVAYHTPEIGLSCRSVTMLSYLVAQTILIVVWFFHSSPRMRQRRSTEKNQWERALMYAVSVFYVFVGFLALCIALAGTIMQLVGVYRNCICKAGLRYGLPTTPRRDYESATIIVSTDTAEMRASAGLWIRCGTAGIVWVLLIWVVGSIYRIRIRERYMNLIKDCADRREGTQDSV